MQKIKLEEQNFDLTKLNEDKNHLISVMVHQIKNPLTSSLCLAELLKDKEYNSDKTIIESLDVISKSLKRINNLVTDVLDIDAIESRVYELKYEKLDLGEILHELLENYNVLFDQKNIRMESTIHPVEMNLNKLYFTQIADNLISNAIKATSPGGSIIIILKRADSKISLEVTDHGSGLDVKNVNKVFDQYKRQTTMTEQDIPREGLGLAIVYKYTTAMGGKVRVESKPGEGTSFYIEFYD